MIEATGTDNSLLSRLRKEIGNELETRIEKLIEEPTERSAGYIEGLRRALSAAEMIGREMNQPQH